jgi:hypothetical protein
MVTFNPNIELRFYIVESLSSEMSASTFITQKTRIEKRKFTVSCRHDYCIVDVEMECLYDKLYILITVPNLEYHKEIVMRVSGDCWRSFVDLPGCYVTSFNDITNHCQFDTFLCILDIDSKQFQSFQYCIQYRYGSTVLWENNNGKNFTMDLWRREVLRLKKPRQCINEMDLRRVPFQFVM